MGQRDIDLILMAAEEPLITARPGSNGGEEPEPTGDEERLTIETNKGEPVYQFSSVISTALFTGQTHRLGKMMFPAEDIWICPINIRAHWIIVIIMMSEQVIVLMDPLGNEKSYHSMLHENWRLFLRMNLLEEKASQYNTWIMEHSNQQDSSSCGVLILMFAKEFLRTRTISAVRTSAEAVRDARLEIASTLLQYKGINFDLPGGTSG